MSVSSIDIYKEYFKILKQSPAVPKKDPLTADVQTLVKYYDCFLLDGYGTLYDDQGLYEDSKEFVLLLRKLFKQIRLVTNSSSKSIKRIQEDLQEKDLYFHTSEIISSGSLLKTLNEGLKIEEAYVYGNESSLELLEESQIQYSQSPKNNVVILTSNLENGAKAFQKSLEILSKDNSLLIVNNPDVISPFRDNVRKNVTGSTAWKLYLETNCRILHLGKPFPLIFKRATQSLIPSKGSVIMIGDTIGTDIAGSVFNDIDSALLLRGNSGGYEFREEEYHLNLKPTYYLNSLKS